MFDTDFPCGSGMVKYTMHNKIYLLNLYGTAKKLKITDPTIHLYQPKRQF